jgi:hypothetical protein
VFFQGQPIEDAFSNIVLSVAGQDYLWGTTVGEPDFYLSTSEGLVAQQILPGASASFLTFDFALMALDATVALNFGAHLVEGGGTLALFDTPVSLFVDLPEGPAAVPEPGTLLLLATGLALAARRHARRRPPSAR